jgi:hypothetical protein
MRWQSVRHWNLRPLRVQSGNRKQRLVDVYVEEYQNGSSCFFLIRADPAHLFLDVGKGVVGCTVLVQYYTVAMAITV